MSSLFYVVHESEKKMARAGADGELLSNDIDLIHA